MDELDRVSVMQKVIEKHIKQKEGARILQLSKRQMIRLVKKYRRDGAAGLISKQRGQISNYKYSATFKGDVMKLVKLRYHDFGPTLAHEKLLERNKLRVLGELVQIDGSPHDWFEGRADKYLQ